MALTPEQLAMRMTGIGGSEIAAVLGESKFATPFDIYLRKKFGHQSAQTEDMARGNFLEAGIAQWYAHRTGREITQASTVRHATVEMALCTPDFYVSIDGAPDRLLSIKSPRRSYAWGPDGGEQVPQEYILQLQWEHLIVSSHHPVDQEMHLAALVDGELRVYSFAADIELQKWMLDYASAWWAKHIVANVEPNLEVSAGATKYLRAKFAVESEPMRPATVLEDLAMLELCAAERETEKWQGEVDLIRLGLLRSIGPATGIESPAGKVTCKADKNGKRSLRTRWTKE
jgi:predicted phage-related endonuclease